ncbi:MAG: endonuclease family protein [Parcubacteria group bacterium]|nr:endonuclease family protein [Parcubacteria group bacterium]
MKPAAFKRIVWNYYKEHGRDSLPWRKTRDPYKILVSEIMLQQTQVDRVIPKYNSFLKKFPTVKALSSASLRAVLLQWQGLGYNRRAVNLKRAAETIVKEFNGTFPKDEKALLSLPGIGKATAGDLLAFAWNKTAIVIETNVRTVFIHHFFPDKNKVSDKELIPLIESTLPRQGLGQTRDWYYALMDYGTYLKKAHGNNIKKSAHYKKQSKFKGSNRELRSKILKLILNKRRTEAEITKLLETSSEPVRKNLLALLSEGLIRKHGQTYTS